MKDVITYPTFKESPTLFWLRIHLSNTDSDALILPQLAVSSHIFCVIYLVTITDTKFRAFCQTSQRRFLVG